MTEWSCPRCRRPMRECEWHAYRRCEDCFNRSTPAVRYDERRERIIHDPETQKSEIAALYWRMKDVR